MPVPRPPPASSDAVRRVMRANRAKDTRPEILLRTALREVGCGGYRLHWGIPGRPDIAYPGKEVAIFVMGCFWHRCPRCNLPLPRTNADYWRTKFELNKERDRRKRTRLENMCWEVLELWECEIEESAESCAMRVQEALRRSRS